MLCGELALVLSTVLSAYRENALPARQRGRSTIQRHSTNPVQRQCAATATTERVGATDSAGRGALSPHRFARAGNSRANTPGGNGLSIQRRLWPPFARGL